MVLAPLATTADLSARGIPITNTSAIAALLESASTAVRGAAGAPITRQTSTVTMWTEASRRIELPARPVHGVTAVSLDGVTLVVGTDVFLRGSSLWREFPWQAHGDIPAALTVTFEYGYAEVPADVVDLVCSLVGAGLAAIEDGYASHIGVQSESVDDYRVGFETGADATTSLMELPDRTRRMLERRFGWSGPVIVGSVR